MSSMIKEKQQKNKENSFLQACPKKCNCFNFLIIPFFRKTSFFASLTLEAAMVVPIFLFAILNLCSMVEIFEIQMSMQSALHQTAKEMAVEGYAYNLMGDSSITKSLPVQVGFSETYVRGKVNKLVTKEKLDHSIIKNGSKGISYSFSKIMEKDRIELVAVYSIAPRFSMVPFSDIYTFSQAKVRAFTGYDSTMDTRRNHEEEQYVFVTQSGTVYHMDRGCSHLKLSIKLITKGDLSLARNEGGGKYKACRSCKAGKSESNLFLVTNHGDKYHTSVSCTGLKRTIRSIPLREATGYGPCSRCGR